VRYGTALVVRSCYAGPASTVVVAASTVVDTNASIRRLPWLGMSELRDLEEITMKILLTFFVAFARKRLFRK
jgi:hypothetical protein